MKNKKWLMVSAILLIAVLALTACSGKNEEGISKADKKAANNMLKAFKDGDTDKISKLLTESGDSVLSALSLGSGSPGGDFSYDLNRTQDGIIIKKYTGYGPVVIVPSKIEGYPVVSISGSAFAGVYRYPDPNPRAHFSATKDYVDGNEAYITTIILPDTITGIGNNAFRKREGLHTINFPASLQSIGDRAFAECPNLFNLIIPESLTSVSKGSSVFNGSVQKLPLAKRERLKDLGLIN